MASSSDQRAGTNWLLASRAEVREEGKEIQEGIKRQKTNQDQYLALADDPRVGKQMLDCINQVRNHYEQFGNVDVVASTPGFGSRLYFSKDNPASIILTSKYFPRRKKGKSQVVSQYTEINFSTREISSWKPMKERADRILNPTNTAVSDFPEKDGQSTLVVPAADIADVPPSKGISKALLAAANIALVCTFEHLPLNTQATGSLSNGMFSPVVLDQNSISGTDAPMVDADETESDQSTIPDKDTEYISSR